VNNRGKPSITRKNPNWFTANKKEDWVMRQLHAIIVLIMLPFAISAQTADLQVSESIVDYGTIKEGPPVIKKIVLTNSGTQSLTIANAAAS